MCEASKYCSAVSFFVMPKCSGLTRHENVSSNNNSEGCPGTMANCGVMSSSISPACNRSRDCGLLARRSNSIRGAALAARLTTSDSNTEMT
ncbi:hypothetical protein D3C71_692280 [compost metagenome]